jgi:hypothetical protein
MPYIHGYLIAAFDLTQLVNRRRSLANLLDDTAAPRYPATSNGSDGPEKAEAGPKVRWCRLANRRFVQRRATRRLLTQT